MAIYKVYVGKVGPTREVHRTREELEFVSSQNDTSADYDEVSPSSVFYEQGEPEGFESEDITAVMRYANTLRKMCIYGGVWIEYDDANGVRKIEYVHSDYCLYFKGVNSQKFIEGDDFLALRNMAEEMAKEEKVEWHSFEIFNYYAGGRLMWRLGYRDWVEKQNSKRNFWACVVFLLFVFVVHYMLCH
ncbi:MAG: hypothetical protein MJZ33_11775 [Paludibacteraceae bacterium]|nr:hypothetical protein [Paludibacteraceae bacterium]